MVQLYFLIDLRINSSMFHIVVLSIQVLQFHCGFIGQVVLVVVLECLVKVQVESEAEHYIIKFEVIYCT